MSESKIPRIVVMVHRGLEPGCARMGTRTGGVVLPPMPDLELPDIGDAPTPEDTRIFAVIQRLKNGEDIRLLGAPHRNVVPADYWVRVESNPTVKMLLEAKILQVVGVAGDGELTIQETRDLQTDVARAESDLAALRARLPPPAPPPAMPRMTRG